MLEVAVLAREQEPRRDRNAGRVQPPHDHGALRGEIDQAEADGGSELREGLDHARIAEQLRQRRRFELTEEGESRGRYGRGRRTGRAHATDVTPAGPAEATPCAWRK